MKKLLSALLLLLALAQPSLAATPTLDGNSGWQTASGHANLTMTITTGHTNDIIVVDVAVNGTTGGFLGAITGISDTSSLTWIKRAAAPGNSSGSDVYEYYAVSSGILSSDVVTVTFGSSTNGTGGIAYSVNGTATANPFDQGGPTTSSNLGSTAITITTYSASDLVVGFYSFIPNQNPTAGTGWTALVNPQNYLVESQAFSSTQSNLSVAIGTGATAVAAGIADAFVTSGSNTTLQLGTKNNFNPVLNAASPNVQAMSKSNVYIILFQGPASGGWFHNMFPG